MDPNVNELKWVTCIVFCNEDPDCDFCFTHMCAISKCSTGRIPEIEDIWRLSWIAKDTCDEHGVFYFARKFAPFEAVTGTVMIKWDDLSEAQTEILNARKNGSRKKIIIKMLNGTYNCIWPLY